jgi:hypothetical protein
VISFVECSRDNIPRVSSGQSYGNSVEKAHVTIGIWVAGLTITMHAGTLVGHIEIRILKLMQKQEPLCYILLVVHG